MSKQVVPLKLTWTLYEVLNEVICRHFCCPMWLFQGHVPCQNFTLTRGAYHLTENFGNSGWKVNGKITFRNFQPKIEEYVLR